MPVYRVQAPDGSVIRIEGPENATEAQLAQAVSSYAQAASAPATGAVKESPGLIDAVKEAATGERRTTADVRKALDAGRTIYDMPETNELSFGLLKSALGGMFAGSQERSKILATNFPGVSVREDEMGNQWLKSAKDGQEYVIPPGFKAEDIPRTVGLFAAFTPAGRAATLPSAALRGAGTQAAIEASQAAAGGEVSLPEIAVAGAVPPAVMGTVNTLRAAAAPARAAIQRLRGQPAAQAEAAAATPAAAPVPAPATTAPQAPAMAAPDLAQTTKKAAEGGFGSSQARAVLAEQAAPDQKIADAAKRLGIDEYLQPDHITTNQAYRELAQAVKSVPGSKARAAELQGLEQVSKRADDLIEEIGGTSDLSTLDSTVKSRIRATHDEIKQRANVLYDEVRKNVPAKAEASADNVLALIRQRSDELGGDKYLSKEEKMILAKLSPKTVTQRESVPGIPGGAGPREKLTKVQRAPNYALLDDVRRDLTAAKYSRQGPFKDADDRLITMLESELRKDQQLAAERFGMGETWNLAQATSATYKGIQDDLASLFGKTLDQSLVGDLSRSVRALPGGDVSKFVQLVKAIPEDMRQEVVASGLNAAFGKSAKNGSISFNSYAQWYEGLLRNKRAYTALMANLPLQSRKQLSDLYRVSKGISDASRERITTGRIQAVKDDIQGAESLMSNIYNFAKRTAIAVPAEAASTAVGMPGAGTSAAIASALTKGKTPAIKAADELIASEEFISLAKQAGKPGEKAARLRLVHSKPFSRYVRAVGQPRELSDREKWVLQAMQAQNQQQR